MATKGAKMWDAYKNQQPIEQAPVVNTGNKGYDEWQNYRATYVRDYNESLERAKPGLNYVNSFIRDVNSFYNRYNRDAQENGYSFNAADFLTARQNEANDLKRRRSEAERYLDENRFFYSDTEYKSLMDSLSTFDTDIDDVLSYYQNVSNTKSGMRAYEDEYAAYLDRQQAIWDSVMPDITSPAYGIMNLFRPEVGQDGHGITDQWTDEQRYILGTLQNEDPTEARKYARNVNKGQDPYQIAAANEQEEKELLALDLTAAQRELDELNAQYDNYQYDASTFRGRMAADADLRRMEQEIDEKQQIINRAKLIQDRQRLGAVSGNDDFAAMSGFQEGITDSVYQYVNDVVGARRFMDRTHNPAIKDAYDQMTEEEIANYNYHYATGGSEQAQRYLDTIAETLNQRKAGQMYAEVQGQTAKELLFGAGAGLNQAAEGFQNLFSNDDYIAPSAYQIAGGMVREDLADNGLRLPEWMGGASLGQVGYDLINTAANMAPSMAIGALNPIAGTLTMGASAAGNAYQEALNEGYSKEQARAYSALVGASEAGLEYLLGGISSLGGLIPGGIVEKMLDGVDNAFRRFAIEMGGSMIGEGFEEGLQEVLTPYFQNLVLNTDKDVNWNEVAYSALLGALSGGVMEAPGTAINAATYSLRNRPGSGSSSSASAPSTPALTEKDIKAKVAEDGKSKIISTGENVGVNDFHSIKGGEATLLLENGNSAPMDDVNFASTEEAARFMTIKSLPGIETEAANDLYHAMKDNNAGSDTDTIVGVRDAYALGYYGFQKSDATKNGTDAAKLSPALRTAAFEAGQKQRSMNAAVAPKVSAPSTAVKPAAGYKRVVFEGKPKLDKKTRAEVRFMDFVAEKFSGTTVHVYQSFKGKGGKYYYRDTHGKIVEAPNGRYVNNEIWIDLNSGDKGEGLALNTFAHEMYHHVEKWNQKGAQKLAEFVVKELGMTDVKSAVNDQIKKAEAAGYGVEHFMKYGNNGKGMTREQAINVVEQRAMSDFVADSLETMFSRGDAAEVITRLKEEDRGLFDKIKEFIDQWVSTLKQWYSDKTISEEGKMVAQLERFEELQKLFLDAVEEAGANYNAALENGEQKSTTQDSDVKYQARNSVINPELLDPRTVTKNDVLEMLNNVVAGKYYGNTYIPVRIGTPSTLIYWAEKRRGDVIDNNPIAMSAEKAYQAMARAGEDIDGTPHELEPEEIVAIIEGMNDPEYIVFQGSNERYAEVIRYETETGKKAIAILEIGNYKKKGYMNGYEAGIYNIFVTAYPPDKGKVAELLGKKSNQVIYDKKKDASRGTSGSTVPSVSNDASFYEDSIPQDAGKSNPEMNSLRNVPDDIHTVRRRIATAMDDVANTGNLKKWAGEYREKIAQAEAIDSNLKIKNQQIQELGSSKNPKDKQKFYALRREVNQMREDLAKVNKRIQYIEGLKAFREVSAGENAAYSKSLLQQMREQQGENIQQQLLENRIVREELTGKDSDITIMEKEFIRIVKKYEQLDAKSGKKITDLRNALKAEAKSHRDDSAAWERKFNQLMRDYEASGRKIERMEATIDRQRATAKERVQSRRHTELRHKIQRKANELNNLLLHGTKHRNIPEYLQPAVAGILDAINMEVRDIYQRTETFEQTMARYTKRINMATDADEVRRLIEKRDAYAKKALRFEKEMDNLKKAYEKIKESADTNFGMDDGLYSHLMTLFVTVGDTPLGHMTQAQLEAVNDVLNITKETVSNANKLFHENQRMGVEETSKAVMGEVRGVGGETKKRLSVLKNLSEFGWLNLKPIHAFEMIGSEKLTNLFNNVRKGEDTLASDLHEAKEFFRNQWNRHNGKDWDREKQYTFKSSTGKSFSLTLDQIMSLYALSKREQARDHLRTGGFAFDSSYKTQEELKVLGIPIKVGMESTDASAYNLTDEILGEIIGTLSADQRAFVDAMQAYLSDNMAAKGNEVSLKKYGIKLFKDQNYFPLRIADQYMAKKREEKGDRKLKNAGFTQATTPKANNPVVLSGFMDVWGEHVDEMSLYHSFVLPLDDLERVLNYHDRFAEGADSQSVVEAIRNAYGTGASKYIDQLIKDINGGARTDGVAKFINQGFSKAKKAQTLASLSVAIQQPSAILRAGAMIDSKYFFGPRVTERSQERTWEEIKRYAPIARIKEMGGFDVNVGKSTVEYLTDTADYVGWDKVSGFLKDGKYRDDVLGRLPAYVDELGWGVIWNAVKRETADKHPGMDRNSNAFMNMVADRFTDVIVNTQVYDSVFSRNGMMRSTDTGVKMATAFMAEPATTANMLATAIVKAKRGGKGSREQLIKTVSAITGSLIVNSALSAIVYAMRDDDEDESMDEKWLEHFHDDLFESLNPASYVPILRDIVSMARGFDVERTDMALYGDLLNAINGLDDDNRTAWEKVETVVGAIGNFLGIPLKNIIREGKGVFNTVARHLDNETGTKTGRHTAVGGAVDNAIKAVNPFYKKRSFDDGEQLLLAIQRGDEAHWTRVAERFDSLEDAVGALKTAIGTHYKDGSMTEAEVTDLLMTYGDMDEGEIYWKIQEWDHGKTKGNTENYSKFGALHQAIESGEGIEAEIDRYVEHGTEESTIRSDISRVYKKEYLAAAVEDREAIRQKVTPAYAHTGMDEDEIESKFNDWDFEAKYGMSYSEYKAGYLDDSVSRFELEDAMKFYGMKNYQISDTIRSMDKDKKFRNRFGMSLTEMKDAYDDGDVSRNQLINALVYNGMTRKEASQEVTQRDIRNRLGIDYSELDDAYKYGDISRQTLYDSMIKNGATKQEADEAIDGYDWLKKNVKKYPDLTISDGKKFAVSLGDNAEGYTLEDYGVSVDSYIEYKRKLPECQGVDANGDGKTDSGTKRDSIFRMIDSLPISDTAKDGLALISYSMNSIKKNAPWH